MPPAPALQTALLELQRRRLALVAACAPADGQAPGAAQARAILLAYVRLRRSRLAAQSLCRRITQPPANTQRRSSREILQ